MMVASPPTARPGLVFRPLAEDWVILDPTGRRLHVMNLTAALVWGHVNGERTPKDLVTVVWDAYGRTPDPQRIAREVADVLSEFERLGLLEPQGTLQ